MKLIIGFAFLSYFVFGCKQDASNNLGADSNLLALKTPLVLEDSLDELESDQCLIELKQNFDDQNRKRKNLGSKESPICIPSGSPELAFRGRLDVQYKKGPSPVSIAIVVDNSGSLRDTDPGADVKDTGRYKGIQTLLNYFSDSYQDHFDKLRIGIFYTDFCLIPGETLIFDGGTNASFKSFVQKFSMPKAKNQTNYLHAFQHANRFLSESEYQKWARHLILFSDGMPWTVGQAFSGCKGTIENLVKKLDRVGIESMNLNFDFACSPEYSATVDASDRSCQVPISGKYKGSVAAVLPASSAKSFSPFPQTDPIDILVAMKQHILFVDRHLNPNDVTFHTVFLNKKPCFEAKTTSSDYPKSSAMLLHVCNKIAPQNFFKQLTIKGGQNIAVSSTKDLASAFKKISESINRQQEFKEIKFYEKSKPTQVKVGVQCWQEEDRVKCPLKKKDTVAGKEGSGEAGNVNFHLPFQKVRDTGSLIVKAKSKDNLDYEFQIDHHFDFKNQQCGYELDKKESGDLVRNYLTKETDAYRISCLSESKPDASACKDGDDELADGSKRRIQCEQRDKCGQSVEVEEICDDGKIKPLETCEEAKERPCGICQANKWTNQTGTKGSQIEQTAYKIGNDGKCVPGKQLLECDGVWKLVAGSEFHLSTCDEQIACAPIKEVPIFGVSNQTVLIPGSETIACSDGDFTNHRAYECRNRKWEPIQAELARSYNCDIPEVTSIKCEKTPQVNRQGILGEVFGATLFKKSKAINCLQEIVIEKFRCEVGGKWQRQELTESDLQKSCTQVASEACLEDSEAEGCASGIEKFSALPIIYTKVADKSLPSGIVNSEGITGTAQVTTIIEGILLDDLE